MAASWQQIVGSTHLHEVAYDPERQSLQVRFRQGSDVYTYHGVPASEFSAMMNSPKPSQHFRDRIRNRFGFSRD